MNADDKRTLAESVRRNPFWICLAIFALLACERGFQLMAQLDQRQQLEQTLLLQARNQSQLAQAKQLEGRLEALSVDLVHMSQTNATARKIVQDFNIQWSPGPTPAPAVSKPLK